MYTVVFLFLLIRRPPRSTLFPTRRSSDLQECDVGCQSDGFEARHRPGGRSDRRRAEENVEAGQDQKGRSEEHTSELQSHSDLVCRLLLEKKKRQLCKI